MESKLPQIVIDNVVLQKGRVWLLPLPVWLVAQLKILRFPIWLIIWDAPNLLS